MKTKITSSPLVCFILLLLFLAFAFPECSVEARKNKAHHAKKPKPQHKHRGKNHKGSHRADRSPSLPPPSQTSLTSFDVLSFGALGDGVADDSLAIVSAWNAACKVEKATIRIPAGYTFLTSSITLQGPCAPGLVLQVDGNLKAPPAEAKSWLKSSTLQWLNFKWTHNFTIQGSGSVDGQGSNWWSKSTPTQDYQIQKRSDSIPDIKPTAIRFYSSNNVTIRDINIVNSPQCHLKFDDGRGVKVTNITISSPEDSPNTDGIHLQRTRDVEIQHSSIASGDDCVSIQTGSANVHIHHINCGPGHGISIGGLGKDRTAACVSDIIVESVSMLKTMYGARIKTWQGGIGYVKNVTFSSMQVSDVKVPVMIDQFYCDKHRCKNQTDAVAISDIKFNEITGTFSSQPIYLACSSSTPCTGVDLINIQLKPTYGFHELQHQRQALCWNSYGKTQAPLVPSSIDYCLGRPDHSSSVRQPSRSSSDIKC
uniref:Polygalacturonase n=1 Tax=Kalanchoe fedtschenkoi TaxID=63787 RepID=A0A7N0ZS00_KALFE